MLKWGIQLQLVKFNLDDRNLYPLIPGITCVWLNWTSILHFQGRLDWQSRNHFTLLWSRFWQFLQGLRLAAETILQLELPSYYIEKSSFLSNIALMQTQG
jgi:hypothetical protein